MKVEQEKDIFISVESDNNEEQQNQIISFEKSK
jgi:hypothetical protein